MSNFARALSNSLRGIFLWGIVIVPSTFAQNENSVQGSITVGLINTKDLAYTIIKDSNFDQSSTRSPAQASYSNSQHRYIEMIRKVGFSFEAVLF